LYLGNKESVPEERTPSTPPDDRDAVIKQQAGGDRAPARCVGASVID